MTEINTDLASHHIEGYAAAALQAGKSWSDAKFTVPLISHIEDNLYVGGCMNNIPIPADIEWIVSLYKWERYDIDPKKNHRFEFEMYDHGDMPDIAQLNYIAELVNVCLSKGKTLVQCQAGLNRSNLVSALALVKQGRTPDEAISLLREKRSPLVLCNETFENWLREQDNDDS